MVQDLMNLRVELSKLEKLTEKLTDPSEETARAVNYLKEARGCLGYAIGEYNRSQGNPSEYPYSQAKDVESVKIDIPADTAPEPTNSELSAFPGDAVRRVKALRETAEGTINKLRYFQTANYPRFVQIFIEEAWLTAMKYRFWMGLALAEMREEYAETAKDHKSGHDR